MSRLLHHSPQCMNVTISNQQSNQAAWQCSHWWDVRLVPTVSLSQKEIACPPLLLFLPSHELEFRYADDPALTVQRQWQNSKVGESWVPEWSHGATKPFVLQPRTFISRLLGRGEQFLPCLGHWIVGSFCYWNSASTLGHFKKSKVPSSIRCISIFMCRKERKKCCQLNHDKPSKKKGQFIV